MQEQQILNSLSNFKSISLNEMDEVKLMNRMDTKFAFSAKRFADVLDNLKEHYCVFEIEGTRMPSYESLYFDDSNFSSFHDHHKGKMSRFKIRIRKYVESNLHFLEIKHKFKGRTNKSRISASGFDTFLDKNQKDFIQLKTNDKQDMKPCLWNSFNRITLVNIQFQERLTLDFNISFKWGANEQSFDNLIIAELKQDTLNRNSPFFKLMKQLQIRPYRLSKYCIGTIEMHSDKDIKFNRFKKKLLTLKKINDNAA